MYPREIANILAQQGLGWDYADNLNACSAGRSMAPGVVADWLIRNEGGYPGIRAYLGYLRSCRRRFRKVVDSMGYWNGQSSHGLGHDKWSVGWGGDGLLPIASYLYALRSYGLREPAGVRRIQGLLDGLPQHRLRFIADAVVLRGFLNSIRRCLPT